MQRQAFGNKTYVAILMLKGICCSANSLWQKKKYITKYRSHFDHLFERVQSCRAVHFHGRWTQFGLGEEPGWPLKKEGYLGVIKQIKKDKLNAGKTLKN